MTFDELRKTWQSQESGFTLSIDSDLLLREVRRNKRHFESAVFWRDVREVGIAFALSVFFLYFGVDYPFWPSSILLALLLLGVGVFMTVDRILQKRKRPKCTDSLADCAKASLAQVEHQIWLLKNVFWWYLLPPGIGVTIYICHVAWTMRQLTGTPLMSHLPFFIIWFLLLWGIYLLNQYAVRKELSPRRQELEQLLNSLEEGAALGS